MPDFDWAAIEAIAAVAGVLGVIISIVFLIYEVRHNAAAIEGATVQSLMSLEREVFSLLADNAALMTKGGQGRDKLSDEDTYAYDRVVGSYMSLIYSAFIQFERELVEDEVWEAYLNALARHMADPGFAEAWGAMKMGYPASFRACVAERFKA